MRESVKYNSASIHHQHLLNGLATRITEIFNNDDIGEDLKFDIICRLIAKSIGATSVSLLLYKGTNNLLYCAGRYINPYPNFGDAKNSKKQGTRSKLLDVLKFMSVFEFLEFSKVEFCVKDYQKEKEKDKFFEKLYNEYKDFHFTNPIALTYECFSEVLSMFYKNSKQYIKDYKNYKSHIREDEHRIAPTELVTGKYYYHLTHFESQDYSPLIRSNSGNNFVSYDMNKLSNKQKICSDNLLKRMHVLVNTEAFYVGVPLIVNNRCIGILRILLKKGEMEFDIPQITGTDTFLQKYIFDSEENVLNYISEIANFDSLALILSLLLNNTFYKKGLRQIVLKDNL